MRRLQVAENYPGRVEEPRCGWAVGGARLLAGLAAAGVWLAMLSMTFGGVARAQEPDTLMLVRDWNSSTGDLIGWLPTHSVEMGFHLVGRQELPEFSPNEAVNIAWSKRHDESPGSAGDVRISPAVREFEGKKWLPVLRDANMVRIKNHLFLIKQIVFEGSPYSHERKIRFKKCSKAPSPMASFAAAHSDFCSSQRP